MDPSDTGNSRAALHAAAAALLAVAAAALALPWTGPWLQDDYPLIVLNPFVSRPGWWWRLWTSDYWASTGALSSLYRPLPMTTYSWSWFVFGNSPLPFHLTNRLLHLANVGLLTLLAMLWHRANTAEATRPPYRTMGALAAGLLFALNPVYAEAVCIVTGRSELLVAFGLLTALLAWRGLMLSTSRTPAISWTACLGAALFIMVFSKETGLLLLMVFWSLGVACIRKNPALRARATMGMTVAAVIAALYLLLRSLSVSGEILATRPDTLWGQAALTTTAAAKALQTLLIPWDQRAVWPLPDLAAVPLWQMASGAAIIAGLALCAATPFLPVPSRVSLPCSTLAWSLLPMLHLVPNVILIWERGLYIPAAALGLLAGSALTEIRDTGRRTAILSASLAILALYWLTLRDHHSRFRSEIAFWDHERTANSADSGAWLSYSEALRRGGRTDEAIEARLGAYRRGENRGAVVMATAGYLLDQDRTNQARAILETAATRELDFPIREQAVQGYRMLADLSRRAGLSDAATSFSQRATTLASPSAQSR